MAEQNTAGLDILLKDQDPAIKAWIVRYLVPGLPVLGRQLGMTMEARLVPYDDSEALSIEVKRNG